MTQFKSQKMKLANFFHTLRDQPNELQTLNKIPLKKNGQESDYDLGLAGIKGKHLAKSFRVNKLD